MCDVKMITYKICSAVIINIYFICVVDLNILKYLKFDHKLNNNMT